MNRIEMMNAAKNRIESLKRKKYLSRRVRSGLESIANRIDPDTVEEFEAIRYIESLLGARMAAPKAHDAPVSSDSAGGGNSAGRDGRPR